MDKVSIGGAVSSFTHVAGDLTTVIGRMHHNVSQNIYDRAGPRLALGVFVGDSLGHISGGGQIEILEPTRGQISRLLLAAIQVKVRPHWDTLSLLRQPLQPDSLSPKNVSY